MDNNKHDKISPTADLISYFRIFSDVPYTKEIAEITDAEKIAREILGDHFKDSLFLAVMSESRYKKIDIQARKYKNILEVAVGRSPRGLIFTEDPTINYVATDLPESLKNHEAIIKELMTRHTLKRPNLHFASVNALNYDEFKKASNILPDGPVAIISEGFMPYLPREEKKIFLKNVLEIISKRGGCLVTSDVNYFKKNGNGVSGILESIAKTSGRDMRDCGFENEDDARRFFLDAGFESEIFSDPVDISSMSKLSLQDNPKAQRVASFPVWVLKYKK